jgi:trehalose-phosphatase
MKNLLSDWPEIPEQIQQSRHVLFMADFDGTLTPIVERPELAIMPEAGVTLLRELASHRNITVGIISGRSLEDLKKRVNVEGIIYAGNHGFEIEGPGLSFVNPIVAEIRPFFRIVRQLLTMTLGSIKGVLVEDKGITLSVHYRQVDDSKAKDVEDLVEHAVKSTGSLGLFKITSGKKVFEVRPAVDWDKGKAIRLLMKRYGRGGRTSGLLPIYIGDDQTDEDGFQMIEKYGNGITVRVGATPVESVARYSLPLRLKSTISYPCCIITPIEVNYAKSFRLPDRQLAGCSHTAGGLHCRHHCPVLAPQQDFNLPGKMARKTGGWRAISRSELSRGPVPFCA